MSYTHFFRYLHNIDTVFEIGANIGQDSGVIYSHFTPSTFIMFEPNINVHSSIKSNIEVHTKNYTLVDKAALDVDDVDIKFYLCKSNSGASSILGKVQPEFCNIADAESGFTQAQKQQRLDVYCNDIDWEPITVKTIRLDTYCTDNNISNIDLICMDVEGVGLKVLKGLGDMIHKVKYIICECDYGYTRKNEDTFAMIHEFLVQNGFKIIENKFQVSILSDCLWENTTL